MAYFVYILVSRSGNALYVGATNDLHRRLDQHRARIAGAHTARYRIDRLVWFEVHARIDEARARERSLKRWRREWKDALVAQSNPGWRDVSTDIPYV